MRTMQEKGRPARQHLCRLTGRLPSFPPRKARWPLRICPRHKSGRAFVLRGVPGGHCWSGLRTEKLTGAPSHIGLERPDRRQVVETWGAAR